MAGSRFSVPTRTRASKRFWRRSPTVLPSNKPFTTSKRHDVKEVWGSGQQQVRNIWTNLAVYNLNLWMHTLVELWAWDQSGKQLVDRSNSPWDDAERRPSHADRRKALRRQILRNELSSITTTWLLPQKILALAKDLLTLAA